jgi:hypothetical protein
MIQFTTKEKEIIASKLMEQFTASHFDKMARFAASVDLVPADMTNISKSTWKEQPYLIGDAKWVKIARIVGFDKRKDISLKTAQTDTFKYMINQLTMTQQDSLANMMVDDAGLGKTVAATWYAANNKYAFLIKCDNNPKKTNFIRALAQSVGIGRDGRLEELLEDTIYILRQMENPILILDEAGDLEDSAILVLKRLYNALKGICAFYLIGADGMRKKIKTGVANEKLGFIEVFSRFGRNFKKVTPELFDEKITFYKRQAMDISLANGLSKDEAVQIAKLITKGGQLNDMRFVESAVKGFLKQKRIAA